jgi:hypothetical protein
MRTGPTLFLFGTLVCDVLFLWIPYPKFVVSFCAHHIIFPCYLDYPCTSTGVVLRQPCHLSRFLLSSVSLLKSEWSDVSISIHRIHKTQHAHRHIISVIIFFFWIRQRTRHDLVFNNLLQNISCSQLWIPPRDMSSMLPREEADTLVTSFRTGIASSPTPLPCYPLFALESYLVSSSSSFTPCCCRR